MTPHADSTLPEDPVALAAMIAALRGELAEERTARRIAELGLQAKTLEAERLRVQIARLRHERFGRSSERLRPLVDALARHVMDGGVLHADDTPVPVLAPSMGKTRTGRLWAYLRDERPHGGDCLGFRVLPVMREGEDLPHGSTESAAHCG